MIMSSVLSSSQEIWAAAGPDRQRATVHGMRAGGNSSFVLQTLLRLQAPQHMDRKGLGWPPWSEIGRHSYPGCYCLVPPNEKHLHSLSVVSSSSVRRGVGKARRTGEPRAKGRAGSCRFCWKAFSSDSLKWRMVNVLSLQMSLRWLHNVEIWFRWVSSTPEDPFKCNVGCSLFPYVFLLVY